MPAERKVHPWNLNAIRHTIEHMSTQLKHNSIQRMDNCYSTISQERNGLHSLHCSYDEFVTWRWSIAVTNEKKYPVMPRTER